MTRRRKLKLIPDAKRVEWHVYQDTHRDTKDRYILDSENTLIADCFADSAWGFGLPDRPERAKNARLIAKAPRLNDLAVLIARMTTAEEYGDNQPESEDWISTVNNLIGLARKITGIGNSKPKGGK